MNNTTPQVEAVAAEKPKYEKDNRIFTLIKKTSKKGATYYSIMEHLSDGTVRWNNDQYATVSKSGHIAVRVSEKK